MKFFDLFKKTYAADVIYNGVIVGSSVQAVYAWRSPKDAYDMITLELNKRHGSNYNQINFRRVKQQKAP